MTRRASLGAMAFAAMSAAGAAWAAEQEPASLSRSVAWVMEPGGDPSRAQLVQVAWPDGEPPPGGFPVMILLDGQTSFPIAVASLRAQERRVEVTRVKPAIIVGLSGIKDGVHDGDARARDYTLPGPNAPAGTGGADAFLAFIEEELKPALEQRFVIDRDRYAIFGHSYGGLFVLHALFSRPGTFRRMIAASPSIWWQEGVLLKEEPHLLAQPRELLSRIGLLVPVGGDESPDAPGLSEERRERMRRSAMQARARALTERLTAAGLPSDYLEFPGENHGSVIAPAIGRAMRFALGPDA
ncbi:alpha/beta hydrolase [Acetobacteraceae bacterium H6797]|nr:alpha/beta hydrolase [Acetobacteraceae bacterium H6797]